MSEIKIVVLTKNFGYNFTGATVATHKLIQKWSEYDEVKSITVLTLNIGEFVSNSKLSILQLQNNNQLKRKANQLNTGDTIFYSDDHLGYLLKGLLYIHTYHGNWPDARFISPAMFIKSFYFINRYADTIRHAHTVVNVSKYMQKFTDRYNKRSVVIRNGISNNTSRVKTKDNKVLMIGSIESRKYGRLLKLLKLLPANVRIDAYGNNVDKNLKKKLDKYNNFNAKGYVKFQDIPLEKYGCFLSLSVMENMPISMIEVIKAGIPVVAYSVGGISEMVNTDCGILFDKSADIKLVSKAIQDIVLKKKIAFTMENKMLKEFDWEIAAKKYFMLFTRIIEKQE